MCIKVGKWNKSILWCTVKTTLKKYNYMYTSRLVQHKKILHIVHAFYNCVSCNSYKNERLFLYRAVTGLSRVKEHCTLWDMKTETSYITSINFSLQWANHHLLLLLTYKSEFLFLIAASSLSVLPHNYVLKERCYSSTMPTN